MTKARWKALLATLSVAGLTAIIAMLVLVRTAAAADWCTGVPVNPGDDLDAIVNNDPGTKATTFCVNASPSGTNYQIDKMVVLKPGDRIVGEPGKVIERGPASYGEPLVRIRLQGTVGKMISLGADADLRWPDIAGAATQYDAKGSPVRGTGTAISEPARPRPAR